MPVHPGKTAGLVVPIRLPGHADREKVNGDGCTRIIDFCCVVPGILSVDPVETVDPAEVFDAAVGAIVSAFFQMI